jgi:uncharacterized protein YegL
MSNLTQTIQSIQAMFPGRQAAGTTTMSGPFAPGQDPVVGGLANVTRLKTYNEQPVYAIIDDSGSMSGAPSQEASQAAMALMAELADPRNKDGFRVTVIRFGSSSTMVASSAEPETISVAFTGSSGGTVAAPALAMAQKAEKGFTPRPERRLVPGMVVFMSDGGLGDTTEAIRVANEMKQAGMTIITIGFGAGADVATLQTIATSPQHYAYANVGSLVGLFAKVGKTLSQQLSKAA